MTEEQILSMKTHGTVSYTAIKNVDVDSKESVAVDNATIYIGKFEIHVSGNDNRLNSLLLNTAEEQCDVLCSIVRILGYAPKGEFYSIIVDDKKLNNILTFCKYIDAYVPPDTVIAK